MKGPHARDHFAHVSNSAWRLVGDQETLVFSLLCPQVPADPEVHPLNRCPVPSKQAKDNKSQDRLPGAGQGLLLHHSAGLESRPSCVACFS